MLLAAAAALAVPLAQPSATLVAATDAANITTVNATAAATSTAAAPATAAPPAAPHKRYTHKAAHRRANISAAALPDEISNETPPSERLPPNVVIINNTEYNNKTHMPIHWEDQTDAQRKVPINQPEVDPDIGKEAGSKVREAVKVVSPHPQPLIREFETPFELFTDTQMYRLGDMVASHVYREHKCGTNETIYPLPVADVMLDECEWIHEAGTVDKYHIAKWPNSIAARYLTTTDDESNYKVLAQILQQEAEPTAVPTPADALVVHLRVGDVVEDVHLQYSVQTMVESPYEVCDPLPDQGNAHRHCYIHNGNYYRRQLAKLPADYDRHTVVLVAGAHQSSPKGFPRSSEYIRRVAQLFSDEGFRHVQLRLAQPPDDDVAFMCRSKYFMQGGGGYSMMVAGVVKELGGNVFTDNVFGFNLGEGLPLGSTVYAKKPADGH